MGSATTVSLDNLNVIFDNDTSIVEVSHSSSPLSLSPTTAININSSNRHSSDNEPRLKGSVRDGFINGEHSEEADRESYATCRLIPDQNDSELEKTFYGRLNFWQPVNNGGVLHLVARILYKSVNHTTDYNHTIIKRESFRTPIERPPVEGISADREAIRLRNRHQIKLVQRCQDIASQDGELFAELITASPNVFSGNKMDVDNRKEEDRNIVFDSEMIVPRFNLTDINGIEGRYLSLVSPKNKTIACCRVETTNNPATNESENWSSVSVVQPIKVDFLPYRSGSIG